MINESKYCSKGIKTKFNKSHLMTKKDHEDFENSSKYWSYSQFTFKVMLK